MLNVHTTEKGEGDTRNFEGDEYIYYFDHGDDFKSVCISSNSSNCIYHICTVLICHLYLNKAVLKIGK